MASSISVKRREPQLLSPSKPTPHELKQLSQLDDQKDLRFHYPMVMYYQNNPSMEGKDAVAVIREAVGDALVHYYPIAGRFVRVSDKVMVDCSGQGVFFVEADADVSLDALGDTIHPPCSYAGEILLGVHQSYSLPMFNFPLMLIQVTRFTCGGFAVALRVNHMIADSIGLVYFLNCVATVARGKQITVLPVWCRELVRSPNPPNITFQHREYEEDDPNKTLLHRQNIIRQSVFLSIRDIKALRNRLPPHFRNCSMFEIVTACVWISRTIALDIDPNETVKLICVVSARGKNQFYLPNGYYGNALIFPAAVSNAGVLCQSPLGYALELIKKAKAQVSEGYVRSVLDFLAYKGEASINNSWNFVASDISRTGFTEVDFGWGKPIYGGPPVGAISFYTSNYARLKNSKGEVGMVVPICLTPQAMVRFRDELSKIMQTTQSLLHHSML